MGASHVAQSRFRLNGKVSEPAFNSPCLLPNPRLAGPRCASNGTPGRPEFHGFCRGDRRGPPGGCIIEAGTRVFGLGLQEYFVNGLYSLKIFKVKAL